MEAPMIHQRQRSKRYVVFKGREPGIYSSWGECNNQVSGFSGNLYKAYNSEEEALSAWNLYWAKAMSTKYEMAHVDMSIAGDVQTKSLPGDECMPQLMDIQEPIKSSHPHEAPTVKEEIVEGKLTTGGAILFGIFVGVILLKIWQLIF